MANLRKISITDKAKRTIGEMFDVFVGQKYYIHDDDELIWYECIITEGIEYKYRDPITDIMMIGINTYTTDILCGRLFSMFSTYEEVKQHFENLFDDTSNNDIYDDDEDYSDY